MKIDEVLSYYGSAIKATKAIGYKRAVFSAWIRRGYITMPAQSLFEKNSKGILKADVKDTKCAANIEIHTSDIFLPAFRYHDDVYGMCRVTQINFRSDGSLKITYAKPNSVNERLSSFDTDKLNVALDYVDKENNRVYIGDILQLKDRRKLKILGMGAKVLDLLDLNEGYKVIGNIYEGK